MQINEKERDWCGSFGPVPYRRACICGPNMHESRQKSLKNKKKGNKVHLQAREHGSRNFSQKRQGMTAT